MLYKIRTGDVLLAENKAKNQTNLYLISFDSINGYELVCLTCGEVIGCYGFDKKLVEKDIKETLSLKQIIPKEIMVDFVKQKYRPKLPIHSHDIQKEKELGLVLEFEGNR